MEQPEIERLYGFADRSLIGGNDRHHPILREQPPSYCDGAVELRQFGF